MAYRPGEIAEAQQVTKATLSGSSSGWRQIGPQRRDGESPKTHGRTTTGPVTYVQVEVEKRWRLKNASRSTVDSPVALRLSRPTQLVGQRGETVASMPVARPEDDSAGR